MIVVGSLIGTYFAFSLIVIAVNNAPSQSFSPLLPQRIGSGCTNLFDLDRISGHSHTFLGNAGVNSMVQYPCLRRNRKGAHPRSGSRLATTNRPVLSSENMKSNICYGHGFWLQFRLFLNAQGCPDHVLADRGFTFTPGGKGHVNETSGR